MTNISTSVIPTKKTPLTCNCKSCNKKNENSWRKL